MHGAFSIPRARTGGCRARRDLRATSAAGPGVSDPSEPHTSRAVDQSLLALRLHAVEMGGLVIDQVAVRRQGAARARRAARGGPAARESIVNEYERRLDEDSLTFIALQQPVANDLRTGACAGRAIGRELERVGDESKKIARFALHWASGTENDPVRRGGPVPAAHGGSLASACCAARSVQPTRSTPDWPRSVLAQDKELDAEFAHGAAAAHVVRAARITGS